MRYAISVCSMLCICAATADVQPAPLAGTNGRAAGTNGNGVRVNVGNATVNGSTQKTVSVSVKDLEEIVRVVLKDEMAQSGLFAQAKQAENSPVLPAMPCNECVYCKEGTGCGFNVVMQVILDIEGSAPYTVLTNAESVDKNISTLGSIFNILEYARKMSYPGCKIRYLLESHEALKKFHMRLFEIVWKKQPALYQAAYGGNFTGRMYGSPMYASYACADPAYAIPAYANPAYSSFNAPSANPRTEATAPAQSQRASPSSGFNAAPQAQQGYFAYLAQQGYPAYPYQQGYSNYQAPFGNPSMGNPFMPRGLSGGRGIDIVLDNFAMQQNRNLAYGMPQQTPSAVPAAPGPAESKRSPYDTDE